MAQFWVVQMQTTIASLDDARRDAPEALAEHLARSQDWHRDGRLLMAGAFLDRPDEPVSTMGILRSREDAEEFAAGDPFHVAGMVATVEIRPWADMLGVAGG